MEQLRIFGARNVVSEIEQLNKKEDIFMFHQQRSCIFLAGATAFVALFLILSLYLLRLWIGINYWPILLPVVAVVVAILYMLRPRSRT